MIGVHRRKVRSVFHQKFKTFDMYILVLCGHCFSTSVFKTVLILKILWYKMQEIYTGWWNIYPFLYSYVGQIFVDACQVFRY